MLSLLASVFISRPYLYVAQQDNYRVSTIFKSKRLKVAYLMDWLCSLVFAGIYIGLSFLQSRIFWGFLDAMFFFIAEITLYFAEEMPEKKKPMRYTKRAVRALVALVTVNTTLIMLTLFHLNAVAKDAYFRYSSVFAFPIIYPLVFTVTMNVMNVFERLNNLRYERKTKRILSEYPNLIKIGITGSYGKTSVKNFLAHLLGGKYKVLASPESYNTPMGIAKTVNALDGSYDVLIAEMGARRKGDIKKLMKIVSPEIGVLTGINDQHLETFRSRENLVREKTRVINMLGESGTGFATDGVKNYFMGGKNRIPYFIGFDSSDGVYASDIAVTGEGSVFNLHFGEDVYVAKTALLGLHNAENLTLAAAVSYYLGVEPASIIARISSVEPVPHRLQLISANGIRIIDDTFNSNPDGAKCALDALSRFKGRKILVTPGLVELGKAEREENREIGRYAARIADLVILIGGIRSDDIARGLKDDGFKGEILRFETLADAESEFGRILHMGDNLLLLNDLPDFYDE